MRGGCTAKTMTTRVTASQLEIHDESRISFCEPSNLELRHASQNCRSETRGKRLAPGNKLETRVLSNGHNDSRGDATRIVNHCRAHRMQELQAGMIASAPEPVRNIERIASLRACEILAGAADTSATFPHR